MKIALLSKELNDIKNPSPKKEKRVSDTRMISYFELGAMKLPDYSKDENSGFSENKGYIDINIDGRFEFDNNLLLNAIIDLTFMSTGSIDAVPAEEEGQAQTLSPADNSLTFPSNFNDVSDTIDTGIGLRFSNLSCKEKNSCIFVSADGESSLGVIAKIGFQNRAKKQINGDTVNNYFGLGFDYRYYDSKIENGTNQTPSFNISYMYTRFEEYGFTVVPTADSPCVDSLEEECIVPIEDADRHVFKASYRIHEDYPFYLGFRANMGKGQDDYGLTLGFRATEKEFLSIIGFPSGN